jgi:hypothetical protein
MGSTGNPNKKKKGPGRYLLAINASAMNAELN